MYGQYMAFISQRSDWFKPGFEVLFINLLLDNVETIIPGGTRINFHAIEAKYVEFYVPAPEKGDKGVKKLMNKKQIADLIFSKYFSKNL